MGQYCTVECKENYKKWEQKLKEWEEKYPNHCKNCDGSGVIIYTYDPSPSGVSLGCGYMTDAEDCPECLAKGLCPLCGTKLNTIAGENIVDIETPCRNCGLSVLEGLEQPKPPEHYECYCWEEAHLKENKSVNDEDIIWEEDDEDFEFDEEEDFEFESEEEFEDTDEYDDTDEEDDEDSDEEEFDFELDEDDEWEDDELWEDEED